MLRDARVPGTDEISVRRRRQRLLARAHDARMVERPRAFRGFALASVLACAVVVALVWSAPPASPNASRQSVHITATAGAEYVRTLSADVETIELSQGHITLRVRRTAHDRRLVAERLLRAGW